MQLLHAGVDQYPTEEGHPLALAPLRRARRREGSLSGRAALALVVQAARTSGAEMLYSEDLSDGQVYDTVRVVSPFRPE
jgi:hypothetical protein